MWPEWIYSQGVYFEPRAGGEVRIFRFHNNKQSNKTRKKHWSWDSTKKIEKIALIIISKLNWHWDSTSVWFFDFTTYEHTTGGKNAAKNCRCLLQERHRIYRLQRLRVQFGQSNCSMETILMCFHMMYKPALEFYFELRIIFGFWFVMPPQLALQLHQERVQVVRSNREPPEAPGPRALPQWTLNWKAYAYTCRQTKNKWKKTHMKKHGTWMNNTHPTQQLILYFFLSI